ncbi:MAG: hypothetical protein GF307_11260 [candidate division Zixibacteria bacterium]|nr:hypothetical protein [candidate division Zixibacteria bacterium]
MFSLLLISFSIAAEPPDRAWRYPNYDILNSNVYPYPSRKIHELGFDTVSTNLWRREDPSVILSGDINGDNHLEICVSVKHYVEIYSANLEYLRRVNPLSHSVMFSALDDTDDDGVPEIIVSANEMEMNSVVSYNYDGSSRIIFTEAHKSETYFSPLFVSNGGDLISFATTGYDRKPRGIFCHDIKSEMRKWYYDVGFINPIYSKILSAGDINNDGLLEMSLFNFGPENGAVGLGGPAGGTLTYDDCTYTIIINENGEELYTIRESNKSNNGQYAVFVKFHPDSAYSLLCFNSANNAWRPLSPSKILIRDALTGELRHTFYGKTRGWLNCVACDINGDGFKEVVVSYFDNHLRVEQGIYDINTFILDHRLEILRSSNDIPAVIECANDIDGDGKVEIICRNDYELFVIDDELKVIAKCGFSDNFHSNMVIVDADEDELNEIYLATKELLYKIEFVETIK